MGSKCASSSSSFVTASLMLLLLPPPSPSIALMLMEASLSAQRSGGARKPPLHSVRETLPGQERWTNAVACCHNITRLRAKSTGQLENGGWRTQPMQRHRTRRDHTGTRSPTAKDDGAKSHDDQTQGPAGPHRDTSSSRLLVHSVRVFGNTDHSVVLAWHAKPMTWGTRRLDASESVTEEIGDQHPDGNEEGGSTIVTSGEAAKRGWLGSPNSAGFSILYGRLGERWMHRLRVAPGQTRATVTGLEPHAPYVACVVTRRRVCNRRRHTPRREQCVLFSTDEAARAADTQRFINAVVACVAGVISAPLAAMLCRDALRRRVRGWRGERFRGVREERHRDVTLEGMPA